MLFYQLFLLSDNVLQYLDLPKLLLFKCSFCNIYLPYKAFTRCFLLFKWLLLFFFSICSRMEITGVGLMIAQAAGAVTVPPTTAPLTQHGGLGKAASVLQLDVGDTLCCLTLWCRYVEPFPLLPEADVFYYLFGFSTQFLFCR